MPFDADSIAFEPTYISGKATSPAVTECSVYGEINCPITSAAGADITLAAIK